MTTYVMRDGKLVEKSLAPPLHSHYVISDVLDPFESPADGKTVIHSKSQYDRHLRGLGKHVSESGDVRKRQGVNREDVGRDVKRALQQMGVVG